MEDFVTFEIAQKLKEKGFREKCVWHYYDDTKDKYQSSLSQCYNYGGNTSDAPTISQVLKWLRNEKKIYIGISYMPKIPNETGVLDDFYYPTFQKIGLFKPMFFIEKDGTYDNYEKAALAGIEYVLNNNLI